MDQVFIRNIHQKINLPLDPLSCGHLLKSLVWQDKQQVIAFYVNGVFHNQFKYLVQPNDQIEFITKTSQPGRIICNATCAVAFSCVIKQLYPATEIVAVFATENNFHIDFATTPSLKSDDLGQVEAMVKKIDLLKVKIQLFDLRCQPQLPKIALRFQRKFPLRDPIYLVIVEEKWCFYLNQPFVPNVKPKYFQVQGLTGAYFNQNQQNQMLQRLHGFGCFTVQTFQTHLVFLKKQKYQNHRYLNKIWKIYTFSPLIGQGFPLWLPHGVIIKNEIKNYLLQMERDYGYQHVDTPLVGSRELYKISGHLEHYEKEMFPSFQVENETLMLRPMACPHHIVIYKNNLHSYRDLPVRFAEMAKMARYEYSGALLGLERVRYMELTDAHLFVTFQQIASEIKMCLELIEKTLQTFLIKIDYYALSLHDPNDTTKYFDNPELWQQTESVLEAVLKATPNIKYVKRYGEAAFYGPKLDIQVRNNLDVDVTLSTIQLDFYLPRQFHVTYIDETNKEQYVVMIHRGLVGTFERFISAVLEQNSQKLPLWLSPIQVQVIPVHHDQFDYAQQIKTILDRANIRSQVNLSDKRFNYKLREAHRTHIPFVVIVGSIEKKEQTINVNCFLARDWGSMTLDQFICQIHDQIASRQ